MSEKRKWLTLVFLLQKKCFSVVFISFHSIPYFSLIREVLRQISSAGATNFTNHVFNLPQLYYESKILYENHCAILTLHLGCSSTPNKMIILWYHEVFSRLWAPRCAGMAVGAASLKKTSWYRNIIILLGVEEHPNWCTFENVTCFCFLFW